MVEAASRGPATLFKEDRTFHNTSSPYRLPNDAAEHQRLDEQNAATLSLMGGQLLHCPVSPATVSRVLDVGCGTGATTLALARMFPGAAAVIGLDLSPVPALRSSAAPAYVRAIQGDFVDPAFPAGSEAADVLREGSIDLVFSRFVVMGINDWDCFYRRVRKALRSGTGWVETQDVDQVWYDADGRRCSDSWPWLAAMREAAERRGIDMECASNAAGRMREVGLVDIRTEKFFLPLGEWDKYPVGDDVVRFYRKTLRTSLSELLRRWLREDGVDESKIKELTDGLLPDENWDKGIHRILTVTCGRQP